MVAKKLNQRFAAYRRCFFINVGKKARNKRSDVIHVHPPSPIWMWKMEGFRGVLILRDLHSNFSLEVRWVYMYCNGMCPKEEAEIAKELEQL